jgi:hypothetical protein
MTMFAQNFPLQEFLRKSDATPTAAQVESAAQLSQLLQRVRNVWNLPLVITSWLRSLTSETQHKDGTAVDFRPPAGVTEAQAVAALQQLQLQGAAWGEFIVYPWSADRHWHISLATRVERCQILVQLRSGTYTQLTPQLLASFPTTPRDVAPGAVRSSAGVALAAIAVLGAAAFHRG